MFLNKIKAHLPGRQNAFPFSLSFQHPEALLFWPSVPSTVPLKIILILIPP